LLNRFIFSSSEVLCFSSITAFAIAAPPLNKAPKTSIPAKIKGKNQPELLILICS
jgi:hypothetical protein